MKRSNESGMILIAAMLFSITLMALTSAIITSGVASKNEKRYVLASQRAAEASESAVHLCVAKLKMPMGPVITDTGTNLTYAIGGSGKRATRLSIDLFAGTRDGADNDLDGEVDEADEYNLIEMVATARHDNVGRALRVTMQRHDLEFSPQSAIQIGDAGAITIYSGSSHMISGAASDMHGNAVPGAPMASAIGVVGDPSGVISQLPSSASRTIIGNPQVTQIQPFDLALFQGLAVSSADVTLGAGTHKPANAGDWGTIESPKLVRFTGNTEVASSEQGVGVMFVEGDLDIRGGFQWTGVIVATGAVRFRGGGAANRVIGSAIVSGSADPLADDLRIDGTVDALYSPEAVAHVMDSLYGRRLTVLKWRGARVEEETTP